jgi:RES domain-containing protein
MPDRSVETLTLWRAFVPQWAFAPLSGEGAARFGGRWTAVSLQQPAVLHHLKP